MNYGKDLFDVLNAACILPVLHYKLDVGLLQEGDPADFITVNDIEAFEISATYIDGEEVYSKGKITFSAPIVAPINNFGTTFKNPGDFMVAYGGQAERVSCNIIEALNGQIVTGGSLATLPVFNGHIQPDTAQDIIKICVVNRYANTPVAKGFVRNFGIRNGALASSVAHDSHNIVVAGTDDESICIAVNAIIEHRGGISFYDGSHSQIMPLPVAGLMTTEDAYTTAKQYEAIDRAVKDAGCKLDAPFMTLSFLALPVIPSLKMTDKGLFDVNRFTFMDILA